ncbi:MAG: hypothetical protein HN730_08470, partial [Bdellovibrionales bacterium]|nr:hypothetical protein [Bdellovibrionales bacterium]
MSKDINDSTAYFKSTVDRLLEDIKKTTYSMIDGKRVCESPMDLVKEAIKYMDDFYRDANQKA